MKHLPLFIVIIGFYACQTTLEQPIASDKAFIEYIDPFIGTGGHGHTFPGATMPFGMVQLSPDTRLTGWDGCSGYHYSDSIVYGFSHTHLSGTGVSDYGDILLMPTTGTIRLNNGVDESAGYRSNFKKEKEKATAGYYETFLEDYNTKVRLTATKRAGFHQYTFDEKDSIANVIIDLEHRDKVIDAKFEIVNENEVAGYRISNAWAEQQHVYFVAQFSKKIKNKKSVSNKNKLVHALQFDLSDDHTLFVRVGISPVSIEGARKNLQAEINHWDFEKTKKAAEEAWTFAMNKMAIKGGTDKQKTIFYTALYHTMIAPNIFQDVDGQYRGMDMKIHSSKDDREHYTVFSLWDTYRATHPLYTIIEQDKTNQFINTFLTQYEQGSIIPIWELAGNYTGCMIGYHAIPVIADAYLKGIRGYDKEEALEAMQHSAMQDHLGLEGYKSLGYISSDVESESVSKTLEYAYDDWCIAMMAKEMGRDSIYKHYIKRSQAYKNILDPSTKFMRAKLNNTWISPFAPEEVNFHFTEANSWQYSFYVPHDIEGFANLIGGKDALVNQLDKLFTASSETSGREQVDITGLIGQYAHGNEPSHHMAYLYNYVDQPWNTQKLVHQILNELYTDQPDGLSGNEDCGQMSAWYVFSAMGFYPVTPGDNNYTFGTPIFPEVSLQLENGNQFVVKAKDVSNENAYIQSVSLNGEAYHKLYIQHEDIMKGGELVFQMGSSQNRVWGLGDKNRPPSAITEELILPLPFIKKGKRAFMDSTAIELGHILKDVDLYYTIDGSEVSAKPTRYDQPIFLDSTTTIHFFAQKNNYNPSKKISATFHKIPTNRNIKLSKEYATQYAAGGDQALIDFIRGTPDFRVGAWQGYEGIDMEATVDLGNLQSVKKVTLGCLQDQNSWIFMPEEVSFHISKDGTSFQKLHTAKNNIPDSHDGAIMKAFELKENIEARYIKIVAQNRKTVPDWHKGAGGKAWIFVDEITIE